MNAQLNNSLGTLVERYPQEEDRIRNLCAQKIHAIRIESGGSIAISCRDVYTKEGQHPFKNGCTGIETEYIRSELEKVKAGTRGPIREDCSRHCIFDSKPNVDLDHYDYMPPPDYAPPRSKSK